jgi:hypothetical protein
MPRSFNTSGPCILDQHYMVPALRRLPTIRRLIDEQRYFVLHAPRQVGKTTSLLALAQELTQSGRFVSAVLSMETGEPYAQKPGAAERAILHAWRGAAAWQLPADMQPPPWPRAAPGARIGGALRAWVEVAPRPLVLFLDEIDALQDQTLRSILRQLRDGYGGRPRFFPWALVLCGMRDVRDYKIASGGSDRLGTSSPFNVKDESLTLRNFLKDEVAELYQQHTDETGQAFLPEAVKRAYDRTQGQPWLVNALARQVVETVMPDRAVAITAQHIEEAEEILILRRDTHLDSLAERLREARVRRIIEPILCGDVLTMEVMNDDLLYARDLGLVADKPNVRIANPIYQEIIPRSLTYVMQASIVQEAAWYQLPDSSLDMPALLRAFQRFFAQHSETWLGRYDYHEAGPHLILMAFLQRVINGGGRIDREFAIGSGRADLVVSFQGRRYGIELKLRYGDGTEEQGIEQLSRYLERLGEEEGYLVIFDRRAGVSWQDKLFERQAVGTGGQRIHVFGV